MCVATSYLVGQSYTDKERIQTNKKLNIKLKKRSNLIQKQKSKETYWLRLSNYA